VVGEPSGEVVTGPIINEKICCKYGRVHLFKKYTMYARVGPGVLPLMRKIVNMERLIKDSPIQIG
jgi:hypothetical protein